jgi:hypothetical protein
MTALHRWLTRASPAAFTAYATLAAFATYFCMYGFRKAFAVGTYAGHLDVPLLGALDLKSAFVIAQVLGYAASKFLGIKIVSELSPARRAGAILVLIGASELALLLFAIIPSPWSALALVLNGLPLGMIWGLVFGFLEGRKVSDLLGAGLCVSFIVSSGFVKTVGKWVMASGVSEAWMPFVVGLMFYPPLVLFVALLAQIPPPTAEDEALRTKRLPMDAASRRAFFAAYAPGLVALVGLYVLLTAYRDFRDNFAREIWDALGFAGAPEILTTAELPVALGALIAVAAIVFVKDNRQALLVLHGLMLAGAVLIGASTLALRRRAHRPRGLDGLGRARPVRGLRAVQLGVVRSLDRRGGLGGHRRLPHLRGGRLRLPGQRGAAADQELRQARAVVARVLPRHVLRDGRRHRCLVRGVGGVLRAADAGGVALARRPARAAEDRRPPWLARRPDSLLGCAPP